MSLLRMELSKHPRNAEESAGRTELFFINTSMNIKSLLNQQCQELSTGGGGWRGGCELWQRAVSAMEVSVNERRQVTV